MSGAIVARPKQLELGIRFAPPKVRRYGLRDTHTFPLVSDGKDQDGRFDAAFRVPASEAWVYPSLELRAANSYPSLILDCDGPAGTERLLHVIATGELPMPNWRVTRKTSGGSHAVWCLALPVHRGGQARSKPLRRFARIAEYFRATATADEGYNGVLTHNPMSKGHRAGGRDLVTAWTRREPYSLGPGSEYEDLGRVIPFGWRKPAVPATAVGRNCAVFDACMKWAGSPANLALPVLPAALAANQSMQPPMDYDEVAGIARSVERYRREWIAQGRFYTAEERSAWGRRLRAAGVAKQRALTAARDRAIVMDHLAGRGTRKLAADYGLSRRGIAYILKRDLPAATLPLFATG